MDSKIRISVNKESQKPITVCVQRNMPVKVLYSFLCVPDCFNITYLGQILNKNFSFDYYKVKDKSIFTFINTEIPNFRQKNVYNKKVHCYEIIKEKARLTDVAQLCIDNNPKKFRRYIKLFEQRLNNNNEKKENTLHQYQHPISPSKTPLPALWD